MEYQVRASFSFGVKVPGEVDYTSKDGHGSVSIEATVEAESGLEAQAAADSILPTLAQQVKLFVANEMGLQTTTDENGVVQVAIAPRQQQAAAQSNVTPITQAPSASEEVSKYTPETQGPAGQANQPMWDGRPVKIYDNRDEVASAAPGSKESKRPHFNVRFLDVGDDAPYKVKFKGFWPHNKDGTPNKPYQAIKAIFEASQGGGYGPDEAPF